MEIDDKTYKEYVPSIPPKGHLQKLTLKRYNYKKLEVYKWVVNWLLKLEIAHLYYGNEVYKQL